MNENLFQVGPHQLFVRHGGNGKEPIVLLHGIPTNSKLWSEVIHHLTEHFYVITPDMLGYGQSGSAQADQLSLPNQAQYVLGILNQLGIESAHFVGHDLGGGVAQILAVYYPDRVKSLVVTDGVCFSNWPLPDVVSLRYPTAPEFQPSPMFIEKMLRGGIYNQSLVTPQLMENFLIPYIQNHGFEQLQQASLALEHRQTEGLVPYLPNIQVPTTLLWGQYDRYLPPYWGLRLQETIPNAMLKLLPYCGHYSMIDNPGLFAQELLLHLENSVSVGVSVS